MLPLPEALGGQKPTTIPETQGRRQRFVLQFPEAQFLADFLDSLDSKQQMYVTEINWTKKSAIAVLPITEWNLNSSGEYVPYAEDQEEVRRTAKRYGATIVREPLN
jgi:hypothetical protein